MKMNKNTIIFLLIFAASIQAIAQDGLNNDPGIPGNTIAIDGNYSTLRDMESEIIYLQNQVTSLNNRVIVLEDELAELRRISAIQGNLLNNTMPNMTAQLRWGAILIIFIFAAIVAALIYYFIFYYTRKQRIKASSHQSDSGKKSVGSIQKDNDDYYSYNDSRYSPGNSRIRSPNDSSSTRPPISTGTSSGLYPRRVPEEAIPKPQQADKISVLYHSAEERNKRLDGTQSDIFLDISKSVAERMFMGETASPVFEKKGTRISAMFVLVNNQDLYPNFYIYNETNKFPGEKEKVLSMIYNIEGILPGNITGCLPAKVSPPDRDGCYKLSGFSKGRIRIR